MNILKAIANFKLSNALDLSWLLKLTVCVTNKLCTCVSAGITPVFWQIINLSIDL